MLKRISFSLLFVIAMVGGISAQTTGSWNIMPVYGGAAEQIIETPSEVYYISKGHLYSYDKDNDETVHYSTVNKLNDVQVTMIAYNTYKNYLAVVYSSNNIDLLYDNGRVVNMPDVRDANISADKTINSVDFTPGGRIYMATGFGFVSFDDEKHRVAESGIYNTPFTYATELDGHVVLVQNGDVYVSPVDKRHNSLSSFKKAGTVSGSMHSYLRVGNTRMVARTGNTTAADCTYYLINVDAPSANMTVKQVDKGALRMDFTRAEDETVRMAHGTVMRAFAPESDNVSNVEALIPSGLIGKSLTTLHGNGDFWASDLSGIGHYKVEGGSLSLISQPSRPEALTCYWPAFMTISADGRRIYVSNVGFDQFRAEKSGSGMEINQTTNIIESGNIRDVTCYDCDNTGSVMSGGPQYLVEDPKDPDTYYIMNQQKGIYIIKDGKQIGKLGSGRFPYEDSYSLRAKEIKFDRDGNLWISVRNDINNEIKPLYVLPAEKLKDISSVTCKDWLIPNTGSYVQGLGAVMLHHSRSNFVVLCTNHNAKNILLLDHNGTFLNLNDDKTYVFNNYIDQDDANRKLGRINAIKEDSKGRIWICDEYGVLLINDITKAVSGNSLNVRRPKVARNDGTNYADYLLDGQLVFDVCEDPSGRMWFATETSGVYLVSADGTEILENYTSENSSLPSNKVFSVAADPYSNIVYFGTDKGIVSYGSDAAPGAADYSDVYAYPNPVRPDYNGWITITGLMDNSLVKITDTAGNIVCQGTSEGGIFLWDGCNMANRRVRSGVYYVFASQNASGSASGRPATKILVIN